MLFTIFGVLFLICFVVIVPIVYPIGFFIIHRLLGGKKSFRELFNNYM